MHILLINDELPPEILGGSGSVVAETARLFAEEGHTVTVLTASDWESLPSIPGVMVKAIDRKPGRWAHFRSVLGFKRGRRIAELVKEIQPDVIHAHALAWQMGYTWLLFIPKTIPVFYTAHGMMTISYGKMYGNETRTSLFLRDFKRARWTFNPLRGPMIRWYFKRLTKMICVSNALKEHLARFGHSNMKTVHNGIDPHFWNDAKDQLSARKELELPLDRPLFFLAGRLGYDKGLDTLQRIWPSLTGNPVLVLAGIMPKDIAESDSVKIYGPQTPEGMRTFYRACDITLVPSLCFDCFPTTSLESQSCGTPVVVTTQGGGKEAVKEGETGWIVNPFDEEALLGAINHAISIKDDLPAMGKTARVHIIEEFTLQKHIAELLALYRSAQKE